MSRRTIPVFQRKEFVGGIQSAVATLSRTNLRDLAVARLKAGQRAEAFLDTVNACAERLKTALPRASDTHSQLADTLLCLHARPGYDVGV